MRTLKPVLCLLLLLTLANITMAARYWVAAVASNWNNTANWSNVSGGAGGFSVPGSADDVNFDGNGIGSCTIDATVNVKSFTVATLYTGTIAQGANPMSTVNAASFSGGIFTGGSANITIGGSFTLVGTAFTSTTGVLELDNPTAAFTSATFVHNNGTVRLNSTGAQTMTGISPTFYTLEIVGVANTYTISSAGDITVLNALNFTGSQSFTLNTGIFDIKGDINSSNTGTGSGGTAMINVNGAGTQNFNGNASTPGLGALPQLTINKTSGALNLGGFPAVANNFTYTAGTVNAGTSTFCFARTSTASYTVTGSLSLNNISFITTGALTATIAAGTTLTAAGDLSIAGTGDLILNTGNVNVNGNISLTSTATGGGGSATINIVGSGNETIDGTAVIVNQSRLPILTINKPAGTLSLAGNISFSANVTYTAGAISPGTSTCFLVNNLTLTGSFPLNNLTVNAAGNVTVTVAAASTVTVTNTLDLESAAKSITINTGTIAVQGNIIDNNTNLLGGGTGTILVNGTGSQNLTTTGVIDQGRLPSVTINKPSGTFVFPSLMTVRGNWTYTAGTLDVTTNISTVVFENNLTITGSHSLNNIVFNGSNNFTFTTAAGTTLTATGNMSMIGTGNITLAGGTINLDGNLALTNTGGGGGTSVLAFVGSSNQAITSALAINQDCLPSVTIAKSGGTLSFPALLTIRGNWVYSSGTVDVTTNNATIVFADPLGTGLMGITGSETLNNVTFEAINNNTCSFSTGTVLTVTGTLSFASVSNMFINTPVTGTTAIQAQGNITIGNTGTGGGGTGVILINGTGAQALSSTVSAGQGWLPYIRIQKVSGTLALTGTISASRDWTYTSGTVDASTGASTIVFGLNNLSVNSTGMSFNHITFTSATTTLASSLAVNGNLTINGTGVLVPGANTISLLGNWTDRSTAGFTEATSTVSFIGAALQTITSPAGENFTNLTVNNSGAGIQLINNSTVAGTLTMTQGNIDLNANTLTLGLSVAVGGTLTRVSGTVINTGSFVRWFNTAVIASGSATGLFPIGTAANYRPLYVSAPVTGPTTGGTIGVAYTDAATTSTVSFTDGAATVAARTDLNWALTTAAGLAGGNYNLQVQGTGFGTIGNVADLRLTLAGSVVGSAGVNAGTTTNPQINRTGLTAANLANTFYVGSVNAVSSPLPITLVYFTAEARDGVVRLDWETSAEVGNDYFTIQRSQDGTHWQDISVVKGAGTTGVDAYYTSYDGKPLDGPGYYRLQQTDMDGVSTYSGIRTVDITHSADVTVYPNPATTYLTIASTDTDPITTVLLNNNGQVINAPVHTSGSGQTYYVSGLPAGIYFIRIMHKNYLETRKVIIKK